MLRRAVLTVTPIFTLFACTAAEPAPSDTRLPPAPGIVVDEVVPGAGLHGGGYFVVLEGSGFTGSEIVRFGDLVAPVVAADPGSLMVMAPVAGISGVDERVVDVVIVDGGEEAVVPGGFTYTGAVRPDLPRIEGLMPPSAPNEGGTTVVIIGSGFDQPVRVFFGTAGLAEADVLFTAPDRIEVLAPQAPGPDSDGVVTVAVRNVASGHEGRLHGSFQYGTGAVFVTGVAPSPRTSGAMLIQGRGFVEPLEVIFAGVMGQVLEVTAEEIEVLLPVPRIVDCVPLVGEVEVVMETGTVKAPDPFTFGAAQPFVTGFEPVTVAVDDSGVTVAETMVTVEGSGFVGDTTLGIGDVEVAVMPDETPPAESAATAVIPEGAAIGGVPGDLLDGVLVNGQGCEVAIPGLVSLVAG